MTKHVDAGVLNVAYEESGPADGTPVILLHGFPYDVHAYDEVAPALAARGLRVIVPYLRGYGPTRFLRPETPRSGQQAALGSDLLALMDALGLSTAFLAGYDWGGRAACIVAALKPERVRGLVTGGGYNIQNIAAAMEPISPEEEQRLWYQYYFHGERGRRGLMKNRREMTRLLWRLWSPNWKFDEATLDRTVAAFDNPDFVEVVIHSYRHRYGLVAGDPAFEAIERALAAQPAIAVPTVILEGSADGVARARDSYYHAGHFSGTCSHRVVEGGGHNLPQETPGAFVDAVLELIGRAA